jgi:hypothetical protein
LPRSPPPFPTRNNLGVESASHDSARQSSFFSRRWRRGRRRVAFANANLLTELSARSDGARLSDGSLVLNDGIAVDLTSLALYRPTI